MSPQRPTWILLSLVLALSTPAAVAVAGTCAGVTMPDSVEVAGHTLVLNGMGIREATVFNVNVYVAGLYVENRSSSGSTIARSDEVRRLTLEFVRDVDEDDIADAWTEGFSHTAGSNAAAFADRVSQLRGWMTDFDEGEVLQFTYVPGTGLEVSVKGRVRGTIEGADFATAFFSIWLGSDPPNAGLKSGLLGGSCG